MSIRMMNFALAPHEIKVQNLIMPNISI